MGKDTKSPHSAPHTPHRCQRWEERGGNGSTVVQYIELDMAFSISSIASRSIYLSTISSLYFNKTPMAPMDAANVTEGVPPVGDTKPSSNHMENTEAGIKINQFDGERVIVTEQDVSLSP